MFEQTKIGIIINPIAGRGRGERVERSVVEYLRRKKINFRLERTKGPGHATELARQMCDEFEIVIAAGGDGTLSEAVAGIVKNNTALGILPIGSGNDFNKMIGIPKTTEKALDCILSGRKKLFDLGLIKYWNTKNEIKKRLFINTLGLGLDAEIANVTQHIKFLRGLPLYLLAAVKALSNHSPNEYVIKENDITRTEKAFFICIGNGSFEGGGFKIVPSALPDDSVLDMCIIGAMPLLRALQIVPNLIKGTHGNHEKIIMAKIKKVSIDGKRPFVLHGDGEILEENAIRAEVKLARKRINIIVPIY